MYRKDPCEVTKTPSIPLSLTTLNVLKTNCYASELFSHYIMLLLQMFYSNPLYLKKSLFLGTQTLDIQLKSST